MFRTQELPIKPADGGFAGQAHDVVPFPRYQRQLIDWLELNVRHPVYLLFDADVTEVRRAIRGYRTEMSAPLSLTAYITACFARAIDEHKLLHAYRKGRKSLVLFDDVDIAMPIERDLESQKVPIPCIIRAANRKTLSEIDREIRIAKTGENPQSGAMKWLPIWLTLPAFTRRFILRRLLASPVRRKGITGTAMVSAAGMFGVGPAWGISPPSYTVSLLMGALTKQAVAGNHGGLRESLSLTICVDHDVVDGAVAARFGQRFKELIEAATGLDAGSADGSSEAGETAIAARA
jgi:pyruvate/2-oxoglutarate dehydrogenase complex dihydrolipoamide acyltransferase (E2) component